MIIYVATNLVNGKQYVGQTVQTLHRRKWEHEWWSVHQEFEKGSNSFHRAIAKYGNNSFKWEEVARADTLDELNQLEVDWIEKLDTFQSGYNLTKGGHYSFSYQGGPVDVVCSYCGTPMTVTRRRFNVNMKRGTGFVCCLAHQVARAASVRKLKAATRRQNV